MNSMLELLAKSCKAIITTAFKMFKKLNESLSVFSEDKW